MAMQYNTPRTWKECVEFWHLVAGLSEVITVWCLVGKVGKPLIPFAEAGGDTSGRVGHIRSGIWCYDHSWQC